MVFGTFFLFLELSVSVLRESEPEPTTPSPSGDAPSASGHSRAVAVSQAGRQAGSYGAPSLSTDVGWSADVAYAAYAVDAAPSRFSAGPLCRSKACG